MKAFGKILGLVMLGLLLIAATLLINSFVRVQGVSPGFDSDGVFVGLIAVGSHDPNRFYPGMGTLFLRMMGESLVVALQRFRAG